MIETEFPKVTIKMLNHSNVKMYIWILALTQRKGERQTKNFLIVLTNLSM